MHPDPAGLAAVDPANPQSWNRYAYVLNNPLRAVDPLGLDCIYLTDGGDSIESIDQTSDASECGGSGGYWVDGLATQVYINPDDVKAFEQQFGQKVTQDFYVSNEDLLAKLRG